MRIDELSKSHASIQELTSQIEELQERKFLWMSLENFKV